MANPFVRIQTTDTTLNRIQSQISAAFSAITGPFIGGNLLTKISLVSSQDNLIAHKLGRIPQLWVLSGQDTNSVVWSPASSQLGNQSQNDQYINLRCSSSCTISIWVN